MAEEQGVGQFCSTRQHNSCRVCFAASMDDIVGSWLSNPASSACKSRDRGIKVPVALAVRVSSPPRFDRLCLPQTACPELADRRCKFGDSTKLSDFPVKRPARIPVSRCQSSAFLKYANSLAQGLRFGICTTAKRAIDRRRVLEKVRTRRSSWCSLRKAVC